MPAVCRTELTPLAFLERSALVYPQKVAIADGGRRITYGHMAGQTNRMANAMAASGLGPGDRVAFLCTNIPEMLMAHFAPALLGAVLVAVNVRLSPEEIRYILDHSGAKLLVGETHLLAGLAGIADQLTTVSETVGIDRTGASAGFPARASVRAMP